MLAQITASTSYSTPIAALPCICVADSEPDSCASELSHRLLHKKEVTVLLLLVIGCSLGGGCHLFNCAWVVKHCALAGTAGRLQSLQGGLRFSI